MAERDRALARRQGFWGSSELHVTPRPCTSRESYQRYELSIGRIKQRMWYPNYGAGAHHLTRAEFRAMSAKRMTDLIRGFAAKDFKATRDVVDVFFDEQYHGGGAR